ncbi:MAG: hypothetical protein WAN86_01215 [Hyphomicrobiaceae bacterium]
MQRRQKDIEAREWGEGRLFPKVENLEQTYRLHPDAKTRILVATDCLSEGVNLQSYFDAVVHYDLRRRPILTCEQSANHSWRHRSVVFCTQ